jgi:hypothetical protein
MFSFNKPLAAACLAKKRDPTRLKKKKAKRPTMTSLPRQLDYSTIANMDLGSDSINKDYDTADEN